MDSKFDNYNDYIQSNKSKINQENDWNLFNRPKNSKFCEYVYGSKVSESEVSVRLGFLKKVYGILSVQLVFTAIVCTLILKMPALQLFLKTNLWVLIGNSILNLALFFMLRQYKREYPTNIYLLGGFTLCNSITLGLFLSFYNIWLVVEAVLVTATLAIGLTLYTIQSKKDFKWLAGIIFSLLWILSITFFLRLFVKSTPIDTGLSVLCAFVFSAYIIYDTDRILKDVNPEEYILAVINLYLDLINLLIEVVKILDALKSNERSSRKKKN